MRDQLELLLFTGARSKVVPTRALARHPRRNAVLTRLNYVKRYFPELDGETIKVGITRAASGMAVPGGNEIWLNPSFPSYHTVAHEFVHLLQRRDLDVPQGEKSCDVFSLARHWTLNDVTPSYVRVPIGLVGDNGKLGESAAQLLYETAAEAVERRRGGLRNYIVFFERRLAERASALALAVGV